MIERYLSDLERRLPWWRRRRILAEVEDHLRSSAEVRGEDAAISRFGSPEEVARGFRRGPKGARLALAAAVVSMVPAFYGAPENHLPPAPWPEGEMPIGLEWKRDSVLLLAAVAAVAIFSGRRKVTLLGLASSVMASALAVVLAIEWGDGVPGAPDWLPLVALLPGVVALVGLVSYRATAPRTQGVK